MAGSSVTLTIPSFAAAGFAGAYPVPNEWAWGAPPLHPRAPRTSPYALGEVDDVGTVRFYGLPEAARMWAVAQVQEEQRPWGRPQIVTTWRWAKFATNDGANTTWPVERFPDNVSGPQDTTVAITRRQAVEPWMPELAAGTPYVLYTVTGDGTVVSKTYGMA